MDNVHALEYQKIAFFFTFASNNCIFCFKNDHAVYQMSVKEQLIKKAEQRLQALSDKDIEQHRANKQQQVRYEKARSALIGKKELLKEPRVLENSANHLEESREKKQMNFTKINNHYFFVSLNNKHFECLMLSDDKNELDERICLNPLTPPENRKALSTIDCLLNMVKDGQLKSINIKDYQSVPVPVSIEETRVYVHQKTSKDGDPFILSVELISDRFGESISFDLNFGEELVSSQEKILFTKFVRDSILKEWSDCLSDDTTFAVEGSQQYNRISQSRINTGVRVATFSILPVLTMIGGFFFGSIWMTQSTMDHLDNKNLPELQLKDIPELPSTAPEEQKSNSSKDEQPKEQPEPWTP